MYDPANFTPYYLEGLCGGLSQLGLRPSVISSPPLFEAVDPNGRYELCWWFAPWMRGGLRSALRHRTWLRRTLRAASYPSGLWRTGRRLASRSPGCLHVHWALAPRLDRLLFRALRSRGWRIVHTVHDPLPGPERPWARRGQLALYALADALIVHTERHAQQLRLACPAISERLHVIPHGNTRRSLPTEADRRAARRALELGQGPVILFFGMLKPYKELEYLVAAFPRVLAAFPTARLVIAGEPLMSLGPLERQIAQLGLQHAVTLHAAFIPQADVPRYFAAADILAAAYLDVRASGVVALAQSFGVPVVVARSDQSAASATDAAVIQVPPRSPEELAKALCVALSDPRSLAEMGRRAWRRIDDESAWEVVARGTLKLYGEDHE